LEKGGWQHEDEYTDYLCRTTCCVGEGLSRNAETVLPGWEGLYNGYEPEAGTGSIRE